jgi:hypothetical protein
VDDWSVVASWLVVDDELTSVEDWFAVTELEVLRSPLLLTLTPGLMLAPALMSVLLTPTLASTPTFGFTLSDGFTENVPVESIEFDEVEGLVADVSDDWLVAAPWLVVEVEPMSVELWLALTPLVVVLDPLDPTLTPGETLAPTLRSLLVTFAFASTPTLGFTSVVPLIEPLVVELAPVVEPVAPMLLPVVVPLEPMLVDVSAALPVVEPMLLEVPAVVLPAAVASGMQSWCTGLAECSLAAPVSLSASLPAFGWLSSLQSGVPAVADAVEESYALARFASELAVTDGAAW